MENVPGSKTQAAQPMTSDPINVAENIRPQEGMQRQTPQPARNQESHHVSQPTQSERPRQGASHAAQQQQAQGVNRIRKLQGENIILSSNRVNLSDGASLGDFPTNSNATNGQVSIAEIGDVEGENVIIGCGDVAMDTTGRSDDWKRPQQQPLYQEAGDAGIQNVVGKRVMAGIRNLQTGANPQIPATENNNRPAPPPININTAIARDTVLFVDTAAVQTINPKSQPQNQVEPEPEMSEEVRNNMYV